MTVLTFLGVLLFAAAWVTLPLVPALREFFRPTDVEPLSMVSRDNADISRFARHFREYLEGHLRRLPLESAPDGVVRLPDGTEVVRVNRPPDLMPIRSLPDGSGHRIVMLDGASELDGGETFRLEVRALEEFAGGSGTTYRALLGERSVSLGIRSMVMRWVHSVGALTVGDKSHLYGRSSSDQQIRLGRGVGFDRLGAPVIVAGPGAPAPMPPLPDRMLPFEAPEKKSRRLGDILRIQGDCTVPAGTLVDGNLVVAGSLRLEPAARVRGSVKAHGRIDLATGVVIEGSLVSRKEIEIGGHCWIRGPVISEEALHIGPRTTIGRPDGLSTVSGRTVSLATGAAVCGQVVTQEGGQTLE
jgi:cytoskeletal protein CcmA (bactofilin family)